MDYSTTNPALNDNTGFVYRLRSLFDSLVALREIYLDFRVRSKDVFLIKSEKFIIFKVCFVQSYQIKDRSNLQCTKDVSTMLLRWIGMTPKNLSNDIKLLRKLLDAIEAKNMDQLIMLRRHPMFYVDDSRELLLDFVVKFQRIMSMIDNEK
nr:hypothetical protein Itr_chr15CG07820 [Ipomoea trifida]